jgi:hypothetical protein
MLALAVMRRAVVLASFAAGLLGVGGGSRRHGRGVRLWLRHWGILVFGERIQAYG